MIEPTPEARTGGLSNRASSDLDLIRGLAAIMVLLAHWRIGLFVDIDEIKNPTIPTRAFYFLTSLGGQAVVVFFVLSGYLVGGSVLRAVRANRWSWKSYLIDRGTRLYVVLLPAVIFGGLLDWAGLSLFGAHGVYSRAGQEMGLTTLPVASTLTPRELFGNLAFLQSMPLPQIFPVGTNHSLWTLSFEFWYYMLFPLLVSVVVIKSPVARRIIKALAAITISVFLGIGGVLMFAQWLMGAWLASRVTLSAVSSRAMRTAAFLIWLGMFGVYSSEYPDRFFQVFLKHHRYLTHIIGPDTVMALATVFWMATLIAQPDGPLPAWRTSLSQRLSQVSYTCYLVHFPAIIFLSAWFSWNLRRQPVAPALLMSTAILAGTAVYVLVVWWLFERNTSKIRDRIRSAFGVSVARPAGKGKF